MDFRFNQASLLGENTVLINDESTCPIAASSGLIGTAAATGADKMWKHAPASCDSEVTRETTDDQEWIVVKKSFQWRGDNTAKAIGTAAIYLDDAATATIESNLNLTLKTFFILKKFFRDFYNNLFI